MRMLEVVTNDQRVAGQCPRCCLPIVEVRVEVRTDRPNVRGSFWKRIDHSWCPRVQTGSVQP